MIVVETERLQNYVALLLVDKTSNDKPLSRTSSVAEMVVKVIFHHPIFHSGLYSYIQNLTLARQFLLQLMLFSLLGSNFEFVFLYKTLHQFCCIFHSKQVQQENVYWCNLLLDHSDAT